MKICIECNKEKPESEFATKRGKLTGKCKVCHNAYQREYYSKGSNRQKQRDRVSAYKATGKHKAQKYNIPLEQVQEALSGLCYSCELRPAIVIDHNHKTGLFRGGLCGNCNVGIGMLGDNIEGLEKALAYLKRAGSTKVSVPVLYTG